MGITYGDYLIAIGANDITPEQEREIEAREECKRRGWDPDDDAADGVLVWMVVGQGLRLSRPSFPVLGPACAACKKQPSPDCDNPACAFR